MKSILGLLDSRFSEITSSGKLKHYEDYKELKKLDQGVRNFVILEYDIKIIDDKTVISIYKLKDDNDNSLSMRSNVWINEFGEWKMIFHQGTLIGE
ncbi:hypothetical protein JZO66_05155 [Enterococcus sp. DIV0242_7C1]|uniref:DUF4440 domain-containing protein n=1 Tax=Candidatus Enterococcus dunnyi TaxID=1834192 RepID=A0A200IZJ3_9ENTE|nr:MULTISPECIES: hypothetical protein [unclassified Enterococcus]MBO0469921.1 hypothetical protein [Enterococcus sp. DIV0242_7C1]OUZ30358.1 hypothetical protein A5889_002646 [Enterococcus sp. 9D6_DIV0238]